MTITANHKAVVCSDTPLTDRMAALSAPTGDPVVVERSEEHMAADIAIHTHRAMADILTGN